MRDEKGVSFSVSGIKDRVLLYGFALLLGGSSVANIIVPKRPDPFTGTMGKELKAELRAEIREVGTRCRDLEIWKEEHEEWGNTLSAKSREQIADQNARINANNYLIKQCMRATGQ